MDETGDLSKTQVAPRTGAWIETSDNDNYDLATVGFVSYNSVNRRPRDDAELRSAARDSRPGRRVIQC
jgi:hypothetical protein